MVYRLGSASAGSARPPGACGRRLPLVCDCDRVESKRVDEFANMSDEELEAYVNGDTGLEH